jgi:ribonuclease HII
MARLRSRPLKRHHESLVEGVVCGVDEAGRGPLAGPVVAAAVILPEKLPRGLARRIDDSKKLLREDREYVSTALYDCAHVAVGTASVSEIDTINILHASLLAMARAIEALTHPPCHALVDGTMKPKLDLPMTTVIGGDGIELSIAAASIVAKAHRDAIMRALHEEHPHYGWATNVGYSCRAHHAGMAAHGVTPHHRTSFWPVRAALGLPDKYDHFDAAAE